MINWTINSRNDIRVWIENNRPDVVDATDGSKTAPDLAALIEHIIEQADRPLYGSRAWHSYLSEFDYAGWLLENE